MNLTYDVIIKRTPYGLIASVPDLDLRIIHNDKELNDCLAQHSVMSLNDFLELYYDTFLFTLSSRIEEEIALEEEAEMVVVILDLEMVIEIEKIKIEIEVIEEIEVAIEEELLLHLNQEVKIQAIEQEKKINTNNKKSKYHLTSFLQI